MKARVWNPVAGMMLYKCMIDGETGKAVDALKSGCAKDGHLLIHLLDWPVMMSTGLKDKSGKEVWEGDVVLIDEDSEMIGICEFQDGKFTIHWKYRKPKKEQRTDFFLRSYGSQEAGDRWEVIGTFYEHPHLLKV